MKKGEGEEEDREGENEEKEGEERILLLSLCLFSIIPSLSIVVYPVYLFAPASI